LDQKIEGCAFAPRCSIAAARCASDDIPVAALGNGRSARCITPFQ
jgi:ABC-type dipeptide/oligopeptide/nickel transport system ATPase component